MRGTHSVNAMCCSVAQSLQVAPFSYFWPSDSRFGAFLGVTPTGVRPGVGGGDGMEVGVIGSQTALAPDCRLWRILREIQADPTGIFWGKPAGTAMSGRDCHPAFSLFLPPLAKEDPPPKSRPSTRQGRPAGPRDSLPPKRKCPAKVATKWPLGTFKGVKTTTPQHRFRPMFTGLLRMVGVTGFEPVTSCM